MLKEYEWLRQQIRDCRIKDKNYFMCIKLCRDYLKLLKTENPLVAKDDYRFIYHEIALDNKKLGNVDEAIKYCIVSLSYLDNVSAIENIDYRYINSVWLLATCYEEKGNVEKATEQYYRCSKMYRLIGEEKLRMCVLFNIAKLNKDFKNVNRLIQLQKEKCQEFKEVAVTHGEMENILKDMCKEAIELYIKHNPKGLTEFLLYIVPREYGTGIFEEAVKNYANVI